MFPGSSGYPAYQAFQSPFKRDPMVAPKTVAIIPNVRALTPTPKPLFGLLSLSRDRTYTIAPLSDKEKKALSHLKNSLPPKYFDLDTLADLINSPNAYTIHNMRELAQANLPGNQAQIERVVRQARLRVEEELAKNKTPAKQFAVVFDVDNTLLDSTGLELTFRFPTTIKIKWQVKMANRLTDLHIFPSNENLAKLTWMIQSEAPPIEPVCRFLHDLKKMGVKVYIISGRMDLGSIRNATIANLDKVGITKHDYDGIYFKNPNLTVTEGKAAIYQNIEDGLGHPLFFVMGDQEYDQSGLENSSTLFYLLPDPLRRNNFLLSILPKTLKDEFSLIARQPVNALA